MTTLKHLSSRALLLFLIAVMCVALAACGDDDSDNGGGSDTATSSSGTDASTSGMTSSSGADASSSGMTSSGADASSSGMTSSGADASSSGMDASSSGMDASSSGMDTSSSGMDTSSSGMMSTLTLSDTITDISFNDCMLTACGGPLEGEWDVTATCITIDLSMCPTATINLDSNDSKGAVLFDASGVYERVAEVDASATVTLPSECTSGAPCSFIPSAVPDTFESCTDAAGGDGCDCTVIITDSINEVGTWTTNGNDLTVTVGSEETTVEYCSDGIQATSLDGVEGVMTSFEKR